MHTDSLLALSDALWNGAVSTADPAHHPFAALNRIEEVAEGIAFYKGFSNLTAVTTGAGLVLVDTGSYHPAAHKRSYQAVRGYTAQPLHTAIYTHGHVDHAYGLPPFLAEPTAAPAIVGHSLVEARMRRYIDTAGYNEVINNRQFGTDLRWPVDPNYPTRVFHESLHLQTGRRQFELHHARGETDDHAWIFLQRERVLWTGDLFIWAAPNAGNPQKVQRYAADWARALREMAACAPVLLLPGHGLPVAGEDRVKAVLLDTAEYLESLYSQTLAMMNSGAAIVDIIHEIQPPPALREKPYLRPVYDEPEFIVRNIHRCLGGWYSGVPSELKPAPRAQQAREIAALAGGIGPLLKRAAECAEAGDFRMACHLADWAADAEPASRDTHQVRASIYERRAAQETSTMSKGIFGAAAREAKDRLPALPEIV